MNSPSPAHFADQALHRVVRVRENTCIARDTYRLQLECPEMARRITPGQFLMLRLADSTDPLLGRPLALFDTVLSSGGQPWGMEVVYLVVGKLTGRLVQISPGQKLEVWGPLGNGFDPQEVEHLLMVAGGIGQTPFVAVAQEWLGHRQYGDPPRRVAAVARATLCYGARSAEFLAGVEDFQRLGVDVHLATDDGSRGHHGLVTNLLTQVLKEVDQDTHVVCCGPEPMMKQVARITQDRDISCQVSLETPMACGIGICFTCVAKVRDARGAWDYKRTCVEGPVFDARQIVW